MRRTLHTVLALLATLALAGCCCRTSCPCPRQPIPIGTIAPPSAGLRCADLAHDVPYRLGLDELVGGDAITIEGLRGDRARLEEGGTYCVWGRVRRPAAAGEAGLMLWNSGGESAVEAPRQIGAGPGDRTFAFRFRIVRLGAPHLSLYPPGGGNSLGGIYFHPAS